MTDIEKKEAAKKNPPRGGKKGGTRYPRINLEQAVEYAKKLVAKTHTGPLPATTILPGVFGNSGPGGQIRAAALKQFGLLEGKTAAYRSTQLARDIDAALEDERPAMLQRALLTSIVFHQIFETYQGDAVSKAKIEQRAKGLKVHTESASECAQIFIESAIAAKLGTPNGDGLTLVKAGEAAAVPALPPDDVDDATDNDVQEQPAAPILTAPTAPPSPVAGSGNGGAPKPDSPVQRPEKAVVAVNLNVDSSSDPDKLEKQLKLLRQYGVI